VNDLAATIDLAWEDRWPRTDELHQYRLDGDKRLVETTHLRYPNAFGSRRTSILVGGWGGRRKSVTFLTVVRHPS
jgi:hypothetical protein